MLAEINPWCEDITVWWVRGQEVTCCMRRSLMVCDAAEPRLQTIRATDILTRQGERSSR